MLYLLGPCPNLNTLIVEEGPNESSDISALPETRAWLKECKQLQTLRVLDGSLGPPLVTDLLLGDAPLRELHLCPRRSGHEQLFFKGLGEKTSLRKLTLHFTRSASNDVYHARYPDKRFLAAILRLESLEYLKITCHGLHENFTISVANKLINLRSFDILCGILSDNIWPAMRTLQHLKSFTAYSVNRFSFGKTLSYISKLGPSNEGLRLQLRYPQTGFSETQISRLQTMMKAEVGGTVEFW